MYTRMCSLMVRHNFFEQSNFIEKRLCKVVEQNLDETITKCMNGIGCQYKDGCALRMNKNIKSLIRKEIKKYDTGSDDKKDL